MKTTLVFDTNILISGYLWRGKPRQAIKLVGEGGVESLFFTFVETCNHR